MAEQANMGRSYSSKGPMMKFSFFMMPLHHPRENPALAFQRDISLIHLADDLDFDEFMTLMKEAESKSDPASPPGRR